MPQPVAKTETKLYCPNPACGVEVVAGSDVCATCGTSLVDTAQANPQGPTLAGQPAAQPASPTAPAPRVRTQRPLTSPRNSTPAGFQLGEESENLPLRRRNPRIIGMIVNIVLVIVAGLLTGAILNTDFLITQTFLGVNASAFTAGIIVATLTGVTLYLANRIDSTN